MIPGSIDLHVHCAPDARPRKMTALELARAAKAVGMAGLLLKNHDTSTTALAATVREAIPNLLVFGGLALNEAVGGFNPAAVEVAILMGAKQIWMPTHCADHERSFRGRAGTGLSVFDPDGQLRPAVREIVRLIARANVILGTGHLSHAEVRSLIAEARQAGVRKILVNHPEIPYLDFPLDFQQEIAAPGVWFERCYMRSNFAGNWDTVAANVRGTGVRNNVLATDLGQPDSVDPVTGLAGMQMELSQRGFTEAELECMCAKNPAELVNAA